MNTSSHPSLRSRFQPAGGQILCAVAFCVLAFSFSTQAQVTGSPLTGVGETIPDFTLRNFKTGEMVSRKDFAGGILVLDFFAWWCGPCRSSTPLLQEHIEEYYLERGGNNAGIPVYVVSLDVERDVSEADTARYVEDLRLGTVLSDTIEPRLYDLLPDKGGIPYFAIINGVEGDPNYDQWDLVYYRRGQGGENQFKVDMRTAIESITGASGSPSAPVVIRDIPDQTVKFGKDVVLLFQVVGMNPLSVTWRKDGEIVPGANTPRLVIPDATFENAGVYQVEVANGQGMVTSREARLIIEQRYDDWARMMALSGDAAKKDADPDGDGDSNFAEYLQLTNPSLAENRYLPPVSVIDSGESVTVTFQVNRGALSTEYSILQSRDLKTWTPVDLESEAVTESVSGPFDVIQVSLPSPMAGAFWRLEVIDPNAEVNLAPELTYQRDLSELDAVDPYYFESLGEVYYQDRYPIQGLEDGVEYTIRVISSQFRPTLVLADAEAGSRLELFYNFESLFFYGVDLSFVADASRDYYAAVSSYGEEATGDYQISLFPSSLLTPLPLNQRVQGTLVQGEDYYKPNTTSLTWDGYLASGLTPGQEVTIYLIPDEEPESYLPLLEMHRADTFEQLFTSATFGPIDGERLPGTDLTFIPDADVNYIFGVTEDEAADPSFEEAGYTVVIKETDLFPAIIPGDTRTGTVDQKVTWTFDEIDYHIDFYELTGATAGAQLNVEVMSMDADDVRIFVLDAATYELVFKDVLDDSGTVETTLIFPEAGKNYLIGAGVPVREDPTEYDLSIFYGQ